MKKIPALFFIFTFPCSIFCFDISMKEQYDAGRWIAVSQDNKLTVIGVSNPMTRRESEIIAAKEDAARKTAMYYGIQASVEITNAIGSGFFDYSQNSNIEITYDADYEKFIDQLSYNPQNDVLITSEAVFIRFKHKTMAADISGRALSGTSRPDWTRNRDKFEFEGFITAVGFSQNQRRLKDTIFKSAEDAVTRMIADISTSVVTREITEAGQGSLSLVHFKSEGRLNNFQIIEMWIEPETRSVYTLAIARIGA